MIYVKLITIFLVNSIYFVKFRKYEKENYPYLVIDFCPG